MRPTKILLGINDKWLMIIGIPIVALLIDVIMINEELIENPKLLLGCFPVGILITAAFWICLRGVILFVRDRYFEPEQIRKKLIVQFFLVLITYFLIKWGIDYFLDELLNDLVGFSHKMKGLAMSVSSLTIAFLVLSIYEGIFYFSQYRASLLEQERLKKEQIASQLEGLKNQVNPHFLFNSMNTLAQLIPEDSARAVKFVEKMSKVYRYVLEMKDKELVDLAEELTFLNAYLFLLKERFEDNLQVDVSIPEKCYEKKVVPLSLQLLIENAIKHNVISTERPLSITVVVKDGKLYVENKLQRKNQVRHSTKMGLENIKSRYSFFTKVRVLIIETAEQFSVALPLID